MLQDHTSIWTDAKARLAQAGIELHVTKKHVKNINFRLKPHTLTVSVPREIRSAQIEQAIAKRVPWAIVNHAQVLEQYKRNQQRPSDNLKNLSNSDNPLLLWGCEQPFSLNHDEKMAYYRQQLTDVIPALFEKWQPIVGATANEVRLKKMHTRWGSCNTRARRVWLSTYLPAYPLECTEYVIVHELCHLHQPNHSPAFWQVVATAMPDYQRWHNILAGKTGQLKC
ncbi:M48 family metallopeptidase [Psychrobacter sp. JB385]|uniref:M48 family metallopeptidase n=1 Tax=Psychrobacter sp. JB385 TaxID=1434841 RepID=UPI00097E9338|nr:YgjP-like metallopeptidase domain-containing protein [Psychrobacter sp. JB385]SJN15883.1 Putative predicted metal-dependent hydrolase [Psychrobacter sp. JB385]